jgi:hypothetical protein
MRHVHVSGPADPEPHSYARVCLKKGGIEDKTKRTYFRKEDIEQRSLVQVRGEVK